eukprot:1182844-Prorocentrum_minimum.AAC.2
MPTKVPAKMPRNAAYLAIQYGHSIHIHVDAYESVHEVYMRFRSTARGKSSVVEMEMANLPQGLRDGIGRIGSLERPRARFGEEPEQCKTAS